MTQGWRNSAIIIGLLLLSVPTWASAVISDDDYYGPRRISTSELGLSNSGSTPSGAFTYEIPLVIPPGRSGVQPDLKLQYNSQQRGASIYGTGWDIPIPYIERINKDGTEKMYSEHYFTSSLSGELEDISLSDAYHGTYGAKVDSGEFLTYTYATSTDGWTVTDKKGTQYLFGAATTTRLYDTASSTRIYRWMLQEVRDTNDNYVRYEYYHEDGQVYPSKIIYTGNDTTDGIFEVEFTREARDDDNLSYATGFEVRTEYRISELQAKVNGTWVRKYELDYAAGDNTTRSVLSSVTETGKDESANTITLPSASFTYQSHPTNWATSTAALPRDLDETNVFVSDINGDALPDIIYSVLSGSHFYEIHINDGDGTWTDDTSNWTLPTHLAEASHPRHSTFLIDLNGDGFPDILTATQSTTTRAVYINDGDGTGWTLDAGWNIPFSLDNGGDPDHDMRVMEVNGDGLPDVVNSEWDYGNSQILDKIFINDGDGTGWTEDTNWTVPIPFSTGSVNYGLRVFDVNGDNLTDIVKSDYNVSTLYDYVYINNGKNTWTLDTNYNVPVAFDNNGYQQRQIVIADVNGDGLNDIVDANLSLGVVVDSVYLNKGDGTGWVEDTDYVVPLPVDNEDTRIFDLDGDGLDDFVKADTSGGIRYSQLYLSQKPADLLVVATSSQGSISTAAYKATTGYKNGTTLLNILPFSFDTVATSTINDGLGNITTTTHSYQGGSYYYANELDRRFAGFHVASTTDDSGNVTREMYHQGNTSDTSNGEYSDDDSKIGRTYRTEVYSNSSSKYSQTVQKWENDDLGNNRDFVRLTRSLSFSYDGDGDHRDFAEEFTYSTTTGNLTQKIQWGEVTGSQDGTFSDTGSDKYTIDYSYATSTTSNLIGLLKQETLKNQSSTKEKETKYYFDSQPHGTATLGNTTKEEYWKASTSYADIDRTFNGYGLVTQQLDPLNNATNFAYDSYNLYAATSTNAKSQSTTYTYDYSSGKAKLTTDPNTRQFETTYDAFDRPLLEKVPDISSPGSLVTKTAYTYTNTGVPRKTQITNYLDGSTSFDVYSFVDGLGRKVQDRKEAEDSTYAVTDTVYHENGKVKQQSLPYFSSGTSYTSPTTNSYLLSTFTYDPLDRPLTLKTAVGTTTFAYDQWETVTTDTEGNIKDTHNDAHNRLSAVDEHNGASTYTTAYEYNGLGNLTKITDSASNIRNFTYDGRGLRLTAEDLHAGADGSFGTWTYTRDNAGNITQVDDPKAQTISYTYDELNRILTENYTGAGGTEKSYSYDSGTNGIGRLTQAVRGTATSTYAYDAVGNIATGTRTIDGTAFVTTNAHDRQGNVALLTYPNSAEARYSYNTAGQLESVENKEPGGSFAYIISDFDYGPHGRVVFKDFVNNVDSYYTFDANELYRLRNITTIDPAEESEVELPSADVAEDSPQEETLPAEEPEPVAESEMEESEAITEPVAEEENTAEPEVAVVEAPPEEPVTEEEPGEAEPLAEEEVEEEAEIAVSILALIADKSPEERASIKGSEIAKLDSIPRTLRGEYEIEIESMESVEGGVQVFARAWKNGSQIGFGSDGSVEIERFRIFNPPILVDDPMGDIVREYKDEDTGDVTTRRLREDPKEALLQTLEHVISLKKEAFIDSNIEQGKIGNTTSTYYPNVDADAEVRRESNSTFSSIRSGNGTGRSINSSGMEVKLGTSGTTNQYDQLNRAIIIFPTSLAGQVVSSATLSVYGNGKSKHASASPTLNVYGATTTSDTEVSTSDYQNVGSTALATDISYASYNTSGYNNFSLNGSGLANISVSGGVSRFSIREAVYDAASTSPTWAQGVNIFEFGFESADESGTSMDPKLVVEHTLLNYAPSAPTSLQTEGLTDPVDVLDPTPEFSAIPQDSNSGDLMTHYRIQVATSTGFGSFMWDSTKTALATSTPESTRISPVSYAGTTLASSTPYYWRIKFWDDEDAEGAWNTATSTFTLSSGLDGPTSLYVACFTAQTGSSNPTGLKCGSPVFSATYVDSIANYDAVKYRIQVATSSDYSAGIAWDTGSSGTSMPDLADGSRSLDFVYKGSPLTFATTTYYWRMKFWDENNVESNWATSTFQTYNSEAFQDIHYTYDTVGNITQILDSSDTNAAKTAVYGYDDLNRLTSASTTAVASGSNYSHTFTYDSIGNFTNKSDVGNYSYSSTGKANPHAATTINGVTYTYDDNGNLTNDGSRSFTWNYDNTLATLGTSRFAYDHDMQRATFYNGTATTTYPNKYYNQSGATTTRHIYAGSDLVATVEGNGTATTTRYMHPDHLGGTGIITSSVPGEVQALDYYSFGTVRINSKAGAFDEQRKFTGYEYDTATDLNYANARYYDQDVGRFTSQDPVFGSISESNKRFIENPQFMNSYSYAANNPLMNIDPTGEEPIKSQLGTSNDVARLMAHVEKIYAGDSAFDQLSIVQQRINNFPARYIYTEQKGWIDSRHFFEAAQLSENLNPSLVFGGLWVGEFAQSLSKYGNSSFSYEDIPSNKAGTAFGMYLKNSESSLSTTYMNYMESIGATNPQNAPNYDSISETSSVRVEGRNYSSKPYNNFKEQ